MTSCWNSDNHF